MKPTGTLGRPWSVTGGVGVTAYPLCWRHLDVSGGRWQVVSGGAPAGLAESWQPSCLALGEDNNGNNFSQPEYCVELRTSVPHESE